MTTKRQIITDAFAEIGLADYVFDLQAEQLETAKRSLDRMVAMWNGQGMAISYPLGSASDLDDETNAPDWALDAMVQNLALRIAPSFGKTASPETKIAASRALGLIAKRRLNMQPMVMDTMAIPAGAGSLDTYLATPDETLDDWSGPIGLE